MPVSSVDVVRRRAGGSLRHAALLAGASVLALVIGCRGVVAGDLRSGMAGSGAGSAAAATVAATTAAAQQAATIAAQSQAALTRASQTLQAMRAAQSAARAAASAAASSGVTDGLSTGGLVVDPRVTAGDTSLWVNATLPTQTTSAGQTTVTVQQTAQRAIATWQQFNVGKSTTLYFDQSAGNSTNGNSWVVLNRIDATGSPSKILGQIKAEGTVLIINPNGIIFTGTSQINVHTLIASSLDINSYGGSATNYGVLNSTGSYTQISVGGVAQTTASGSAVLAPANEANGNTQFLASGLYLNGATTTTGGTLVLSTSPSAGGNAGVVVEKGAIITTADNVSGFDNGGYVALIGPQVSNAGSIATAAGQIILAAGSTVLLTEPASSSSATGLTVTNVVPTGTSLVYTPAAVSGGAYAVNTADGILLSTRGNVTLVGDTVDQLGFAEATTSITRAGSLTLTATGTPTASNPDLGLVLFGSGSITTILPEQNGETIPTSSVSSFVAPSIAVTATTLDMTSGSLIVAPGAAMTVSLPSTATAGTGRVLLEQGSEINLAGLTGVTRSVSDYLYTFVVTANDVADTPLAQSLIGQTVTIDLSRSGTRSDGETWVGSPLFASSGAGYLANITQKIDQLLTKGGSLTIGSGLAYKDVITAPGSSVNVSGGWISFTGATVSTTRLIGADGKVYDIGSADPFITYSGLAGTTAVAHAHWSVTDTYTNLLRPSTTYKAGYIDGVNAGSIALTAVNPVLEGTIAGDIVIGTSQRALAQTATGTSGAQTTPDELPTGASLTITLTAPDSYTSADAVVLAETAGDVLGAGFGRDSVLTLPTGSATVTLSNGLSYTNAYSILTYSTAVLSAANFGSITIKGARELSMQEGASLTVRSGGAITLTGVTTIDGTLTAHSGSITITGDTPTAATNTAPAVAAVTIGAHALLDVSGLWVNDSGLDADTLQGAAYIDGGTVSIKTLNESTYTGKGNSSGYIVTSATDTTQSIVLAAGSVIDVSSGGYVTTKGVLKTGSDGLAAGKGGSLSLLTYASSFTDHLAYDATLGGYYVSVDPSISTTYAAIAPTGTHMPNAATVAMNGTILAGGLSTGGTLTLQAPIITIDGAATAVATITSGSQAGTIVLPTSFFTGGFSAYALTATYGSITVTAGTTLTLQQSNYLVSAAAGLPATGARLSEFASLGLAADGLRHAVRLSLTEQGYANGGSDVTSNTAGIVIGAGASIVADPQAAVTLTAAGAITVLGAIVAPAGSITLTTDESAVRNSSLWGAAQDIWIGADAVLDVSGVFLPNPKVTAYATGTALDAGSITLSSFSAAGNGTIVALAGARFDLSGASATVERPTAAATFGRSELATRQVWSNGGTLTLSGTSLYFAGTIDAAGGAASASGGRLNLGTLVTTSNGTAVNAYGTIVIAQSGDVAAAFAGGTAPTTQAQLSALLPGASGKAFITADTIDAANSGLDTVSLMGTAIAFTGHVGLAIPGALYLDGNITLLPGGLGPSSPASAYASSATASGIPTIGATTVTLDAGYIRWLSGTVVAPTLADGTLTLRASAQIDLAGVVSVANAAQVNLVSGGDVRFLNGGESDIAAYLTTVAYRATSTASLTSSGSGGMPSAGALLVADNLTVTAREVYPATDAAFLLMSLGLAPSTAAGTHATIAFASNGATPTAPLSAGGAILVDAATIVQGGALYAPLGTIQLGYGASQTLPAIYVGAAADTGSNAYDPVGNVLTGVLNAILSSVATRTTASVTLAAGSVTSVSAAGLSIPYGTTTDGTTWTDGGVTLSGPPAKLIVLGGASVSTQAGAVIDERGGGDVYATEFVAGTGGSRNVLTTTSQTVYALVPSAAAKVAAYDPSFGTTVVAGTAVTLAGGNGIAAGTYVLMPAMYATLPGAYRVVVISTNTAAASVNAVTADGSIITTGTLTNAITGATSSQTALLKIQSSSTWNKYSEIDISTGNAYFAALAATNGTATPRLPIDAGQLVIAAATALGLEATNLFAPASGGRGGQVDITGTSLLVAASDLRSSFAGNSAYSGYLILDADQISALGVESVLIGGTRSTTTAGTLITASAQNLEVATDAAHPLSGPDLLLVSLAPTTAGASRGLVVDAGSVVVAKGSVTSAADTALIVGVTGGASGDGSLLRVSAGGMVSVTRNTVAATPLGSLTIGAGATLAGTTLTLDTSGTTSVATDAVLTAQNFDLAANIVNIGGGSGGLVVSSSLIASFAGADTVRLRSASVFNLYGDAAFGRADAPIKTLTFDGSGFYSDGGTTTVAAGNIVLTNSQATVSTAGANTAGSGGALVLDAAGVVTFAAGTKTASGFAAVTATAGTEFAFTGTGSLDAKAAAVTLTAPVVVADAGAVQSLTTTGTLTLARGAGTAPTLDPSAIGGSLTLTAGSIVAGGTLVAQAGKLTLEATSGDLIVSSGASLTAAGTRVTLFDLVEDTPGGTIKLIADAGNLSIASGATVDVSAAGNGYAGTLAISAKGMATLDGTLKGNAAYNDLGGNLVLSAGSLAGNLPLTAFTGSFEISLGQGDITIAQGQTLTSANVLLVTNNGSILVDGTIDASSPSGGTIALYATGTSTAAAGTPGATGITIGSTARLYARYKADDPSDPAYADGASTLTERGGTIALGTTGTPDGSLNGTYGYQNVPASGAITVASGAIFDVSGGPGDSTGNIDTTGGSVIVRAPILTSNTINVSFKGTLVTNAKADGTPSGNGIVADAFATWSTTDNASVLTKHFDGIVDPAGWYDATGTLLAGSFGLTTTYTIIGGATTPTTTALATWSGTGLSFTSATQSITYGTSNKPYTATYVWDSTTQSLTVTIKQDSTTISTTTYSGTAVVLAYLLANENFVPTSYNDSHQTFYGYVGGVESGGAGTLMSFVQNPFSGNDAAVAASFAGAQLQIAGSGSTTALPASMLHLKPEVELVNPSTGINSGDIRVLTNWNLGATNSSGTLVYRHNGEAPVLTLRAANDVAIKASITDGFAETSAVGTVTTVVGNTYGNASTAYTAVTTGSTCTTSAATYACATTTISAGKIQALGVSNVASLETLTAPTVYTALGYSSDTSDYYYYLYGASSGSTYTYSYISQYKNYLYYGLYFNRAYYKALTYKTDGSVATGITLATTTVANTSSAIYNYAQTALTNLALANSYWAQISSRNGAFANLNLYSKYLSAYSSYINAYKNWSNSKLTATNYGIGEYGQTPKVLDPTLLAASVAAGTVNSAQVDNSPSPVASSSNMSPIAGMNLAAEASSTSYRIVAGAATASADPLATTRTGTGNVTIDSHTAYLSPATDSLGRTLTIDVPTILRTGTGSIDIAAAGSFELLDQTAPGVVYTAGTVAANAVGYTAPTLTTTTTSNGLLTTPVWATGGGNITINVGRDIIGIETPTDSDGSQTGGVGVSTGQFWSAWYFTAGKVTGTATPFDSSAGGVQYGAWINYGTFGQGIGALGGGNVTLKAGRDIYDISVSLPETLQVSGGTSAGSTPVVHYYGGGDLLVQAGGNLYSSTFYVGRGTGLIQVGGDAVADPKNPVTGKATQVATTYYNNGVPTITDPNSGKTTYTAVPLLLAVQDGFITVQALGDITLGGIFEPTRIPADSARLVTASLPTGFGVGFDSFGASSGVALMSTVGDITIETLKPGSISYNGVTGTLFTRNGVGSGSDSVVTTPATLEVEAITGDIAIVNNLTLFPSATGSLTLAAGGSLATASYNASGNPTTFSVTMLDANNSGLQSILGIPTPTVLASAVHAGDSGSAIIYAGQDITGIFTLIEQAKVEAGRDIVNTTFTGQNNSASDITSIIAGRDILAAITTLSTGVVVNNASTFTLYGPGDLLVQAGRNLGPFTTTASGGGIFAVGDGSNCSSAICGSVVKSYLPVEGADITALFGVGNGMDIAAAIAAYIDPAAAKTAGIDYLPTIARVLGVSESDAWAAFQALPAARQKLLVERAFLDFLTQVSTDYNTASSAYYQQYARAYATIATLFPASLGYTQNNTGSSNGASVRVRTGDLRMAHSLIETQTGGDINILGPGGSAYVGSNSSDSLSAAQQGILTLQGGTIRAYTDGDVQIYQSRIFTEQGGDIDLFSANGDLKAGKGPKTKTAYPPLKLICDTDGYCRVSPAGLVTGAGIGALLSVPGQDPTKSNVVLTAPHGTVDAGAAGIRVAGNLNIVALQILNAFNIQVQGTTAGLPAAPAAPNIGALTTANNAAGAAAKAAETPASDRGGERPSVIIVEILGYGGGDENAPPSRQNERQRRSSRDEERYDPNSAFRLVGNGHLTPQQRQALTEEERAYFDQKVERRGAR
ncbi:MAG: filamentous hemagglutinin family protein [Rhodoplanes sp.]|uniref:filamentous haemagglutinin family protein n=1 Tax=Rhodoplanes sp. TaxID=1968906 RepID=UPI001826470C|nr:filamentous haemagglutinin family protein [Rhodoplanes sp.]NVO17601.1 filamentous hemagglutinin family protein [Rhodoplanes sp.]